MPGCRAARHSHASRDLPTRTRRTSARAGAPRGAGRGVASGAMSIVIVGAGLAGGTAATELREQGYDGQVVLVGAEEHPPVRAPAALEGLPARQRPARRRLRAPAATGTPSTTSTSVSASRRRRSTPTPTSCRRPAGDLTYERLLLATGAEPRRLAMAEESGVPTAYLRTIEDSDRLKEAFGAGGRIVVVGAGWIGLEVAAAAREGRLRGDRLRDRRAPAAAGARADRRRRSSPTCTASTASTSGSARP